MARLDGIGLRVARWRDASGMTQQELANRIGTSREYISLIENGRRAVTSRSVVIALATALGVSLTDLTGQPYQPSSRADRLLFACVPALRTALDDDPEPQPPPDLDRLAQDVETVMAARMRCDYPTVSALLPGLIVAVRQFGQLAEPETDAGRTALPLTVKILHTAAMAIKSFGYVDLGLRFAERAQATARLLGEPTYLAAGDYTFAQCVLTAGSYRRSSHLATKAAGQLGDIGDEEHLTWYGMLHLHAAFVSAVLGDAPTMESHLSEAQATAGRVRGNPWHVEFGEVNVAIWRIGCALESGESGRVPALAREVDQAKIRTVHRRARLHIDAGRGYYATGDSRAAVRQFLRADDVSAQEVRSRPQVREITAQIVRDTRRAGGDAGLCELATRLGIDPLDPPEHVA